jgi:hypothetical protein
MLSLLWGFAMMAGEVPGEWGGNYSPCERHFEVLKQSHMNLGVRFSTLDPGLAVEFARALNFWATILDMEWHPQDSQDCSIQLVDGDRVLFKPGQVARAQFPDKPTFQGWIAFNPEAALPRSEQFLVAVHELGHVLGLPHNPRAWSLMYYLRLDGVTLLDAADLGVLAARHKMRISRLDQPLIVTAPMSGLPVENLTSRTKQIEDRGSR